MPSECIPPERISRMGKDIVNFRSGLTLKDVYLKFLISNFLFFFFIFLVLFAVIMSVLAVNSIFEISYFLAIPVILLVSILYPILPGYIFSKRYFSEWEKDIRYRVFFMDNQVYISYFYIPEKFSKIAQKQKTVPILCFEIPVEWISKVEPLGMNPVAEILDYIENIYFFLRKEGHAQSPFLPRRKVLVLHLDKEMEIYPFQLDRAGRLVRTIRYIFIEKKLKTQKVKKVLVDISPDQWDDFKEELKRSVTGPNHLV